MDTKWIHSVSNGLCIILVVLFLVPHVESSGKIEVTFISYSNPSGRDQFNQCCDGEGNIPGCPTGACDLRFSLCLLYENGTVDGKCVTESSNEDENSPTNATFDLTATFPTSVIQEKSSILILVTEQDSSTEVPVDNFTITVNRNQRSKLVKATGKRAINPTAIEVLIQLSCDQFFYQDDCLTKCVSTGDCTGHYTCEEGTGKKVCNEGFTGPSCAHIIPESTADCAHYQEIDFISSSWKGSLICPSSNNTISLNITRENEDPIAPVSGFVTVNDKTSFAEGFYSKVKEPQTLAFYTKKGDQVWISILADLTNNTYLAGTATFNNESCSLDFDREEVYFNDCGSDKTCVRYGPKRTDHYCCENTAIPTMSTSVTPSTTEAPTSIEQSTSTPDMTNETVTEETQTSTLEMSSSTPDSSSVETSSVQSTESATESTSEMSSETSTSEHGNTTEPSTMTTDLVSASSSTEISTKEPSTSEQATSELSTPETSTTETTVEYSTEEPSTQEPSTKEASTEMTTEASTEPTTTEKPTIFEPSKMYRMSVEAAEEELQDEQDGLHTVLVEAWSDANMHIKDLKPDSYNITITHIKGGIGAKGVLVVEVAYTVSITVTTVNFSLLVSPTKAELTTSLQKRYNLELYTLDTMIYIEYSFSILVKGRPLLVEQYSEMDTLLMDIWNNSSSLSKCNCFNISTAATEEYIGRNGEEVSRIYFFIYQNELLIGPDNVTQPNNLTSLGRYDVLPVDDIIGLVRYRYSYSLNIKGEITHDDELIIRSGLHFSWNESVNVTILRSERYTDAIGDFITKVIYITKRYSYTIYPVKNPGPNMTVLSSNLNVTDSRGNVFVLFSGDDLFRYSFHLGLYLNEQIDVNIHLDPLLLGLEKAWKTERIADWEQRNFKVKFITTKTYISSTGKFVEMLMYYLTADEHIIDGTQFTQMSVETLNQYMNVSTPRGDPYILLEPTGLMEESLHLSVIFNGVILQQDLNFLTDKMLRSWNNSKTVQGSMIQIRCREELITESGEVVTKVYYTYTESGTLVRPIVLFGLTSDFHIHLQQLLVGVSTHQVYRVYNGSIGLVSRRYLQELYFESQIARLDYTSLEVFLSAYLKIHLEYSRELTIVIKKQEEYSSNTTERYWGIYFAIMDGTTLLYPGLLKNYDKRDLAASLNVTSLAGVSYKLYTGEITQLLSYSYHFQLHFIQRIAREDWWNVKARIENAWNITYNVNVSVTIQYTEEVISEEGTIYWRLVYFLTEMTTQELVYSKSWANLDLDFHFVNPHGTTYTVVDTSLTLLRLSSAFRLVLSESIEDSYRLEFTKALQTTWCEALKNKGHVIQCDKLNFRIIHPQHVKLASGVTVWRLYYFLDYNNYRVASLTWPTIDLDKLTLALGTRFSFRFYHWWEFDLSFWHYRWFLNFKAKVESSQYGIVEASILEAWKEQNKHLAIANTTGIKVVIDTQTEVLSETGEVQWEVGYHIETGNGTLIRPEVTREVGRASLGQVLKEANSTLEVVAQKNTTYISKQSWASLLVQSSVHTEDRIKFQISLENYYKNMTGGNISVRLGPVEEVVSAEGKTSWKLNYVVKNNGKLLQVEPIDSPQISFFETWFSFLSKFGLKYKFDFEKTKNHVKTSIFGVNMKSKVALSTFAEIEQKLKQVIVDSNNGLVSSCLPCLSVKVLGQQEMVTETGETVWRLNYGVYVNGSEIDASFLTAPTLTELKKVLVVKGSGGVEVNSVSESTSIHSFSSLHLLHLNRPVSLVDLPNVTLAVSQAWAHVLNVSASELTVDFKNTKEYITSTGESYWGWSYSLKWKTSTLSRTELASLEVKLKEEVDAKLVAIETSMGDRYSLVKVASVIEYSKHFPLYFTVKVARKDIVHIQEKLEAIWSMEKGINASVSITNQQEVIDITGKSYWELVYFVTTETSSNTSVTLDSRVEVYDNITDSLATEIANLTDVNGHAYTVVTSVDSLFRADLAFSLYLTTRISDLDKKGLIAYIEGSVQEQFNVSQTDNITVQFLKMEEVTTDTFKRLWRYLVSIDINGQALNPKSSFNSSWPSYSRNAETGNRLIVLPLVNLTQYYNMKSSFYFHFEKNVSFSSWTEIKLSLASAWMSMEEYRNCSCLDFVLGSIREVVDMKGKTFYKVVYFMKQNTTLVDSMVSRKLSYAILKSKMIHVLSVDGQSNAVVDVKGETTEVDMLFGFFLKRKIRRDHWILMEIAILKGHFSFQENATVVILRQSPYITVRGDKLWRIEYRLQLKNTILDAAVKPTTQIHKRIQTEIKTAFGSSTNYLIPGDHIKEVINFKNKIDLYFSAPVPEKDYSKIQLALNTTYSISAEVLILKSEELLDINGNSIWRLSFFVYVNSERHQLPLAYVPGWGFTSGIDTINMTSLRSEVKVLISSSGMVELLDITGEGLREQQTSLSILVKTTIKSVDYRNISIALEKLWTNELTAGGWSNASLSVEIAKQDELVDIEGNTFTRLVYFLKMEEELVSSQEVKQQNESTLQEVLASLTFHHNYEVVRETSVTTFRYESLFTLYMTSPVLLQDVQEFQNRLTVAWTIKSVLTATRVQILLQEEMITSESRKLWKVSYSLHRDSEMVDARSEVNLNMREVTAFMNGNFNNTSTDYSTRLLATNISMAVLRYQNLFHLHLKNRIAETDYDKFAAALQTLWESEISNNSATVYMQEELLDLQGESVWKLSYVLTRNGIIVPSRKQVQHPIDVIKRSINVTNPRGMKYEVVDVIDTVRLEEVYTLYVTRQLFRGDVMEIVNSVKEAMRNIIPDKNTTGISIEWKGQTEFKHITNKTISTWRQLFLVTKDNKYITPLNYGGLSNGKITLNFTSVKGDKYALLDVNTIPTSFARADEQFSMTVVGRIMEKDGTFIKSTLQTAWNTLYKSTISINIQSIEEYIGDNGVVITRLSLYAVNGSAVIDPDTMLTPSVADILNTLKTDNGLAYTMYTGNQVVRYKTCFTLLLRGELHQGRLLGVLTSTWQNWTGDVTKPQIHIHKQEGFVGELGVKLTQVMYTVERKGMTSKSDNDISPSLDTIAAAASNDASYEVYVGKTHYRFESTFSINIQIRQGLSSEHISNIQKGLQASWSKKFATSNACSGCIINVVFGKAYMAYFNSSEVVRVTSIGYTVTSQSNILSPWQREAPTIDNVAKEINNQSQGIVVWHKGDNLYTIRDLYLSGYSSKLDRKKVKTAIISAWSNSDGKNISGEINEVQLYTDNNWNKITRVQYFVSVTAPEEEHAHPPTVGDVDAALNQTGLAHHVCGCKGLKHRKLHIRGKSVNITAVHQSLRNSWTKKNNASESFTKSLWVKVKQETKTRRKRALAAGQLVDDNGSPVAPIDYTVSLDGEDPNPMFVNEPSQEDIDRDLTEAGADNCNCNPGKVDHLALKGQTKDGEKADIAAAVKAAVAKSNQDVNPKDLDVQILDVNNNVEDGKPVSEVTYAVRRTDGDDVEALTSPTEAHLEEELSSIGKSLASREVVTKPTKPEEDWRIPVAVVCSLAGFATLLCIGFYCIYVRRHRRKASLKEAEEDMDHDRHNEEHFTNPAIFNNPMYGTVEKKHARIGMEGL